MLTSSSSAHILINALKRDVLGPLAQLGERLHGMEEVVGSSPIRSTIFVRQSDTNLEILRVCRLFCFI